MYSAKIRENCILPLYKKIYMKMNRIIVLFLFTILLSSCGNDDNANDLPVVEPPRPLAEVITEDEAELEEYLKTHFYNYEEFETPPTDFDFKIRFDTISGDNATKTSLFDHENLKSVEIDVTSREIGLNEDGSVIHTLYYLEARKGKASGLSPTIADSTFVRFEGSLLNGNVFDFTTSPVWFDLTELVRGFSNGIVNFSDGDFVENSDGTVAFDNYGIGAFFMPSALGFYSVRRNNIPVYSPIIFKVDLLAVNDNTDHDNDGVPSHLEDVNGDGNVRNDNTDGDFTFNNNRQQVFTFNYLDTDDDNDGIPTRDEIGNGNGTTIPYPDTDNDGTPDYLDSDS